LNPSIPRRWFRKKYTPDEGKNDKNDEQATISHSPFEKLNLGGKRK
jgi:hypothetical protein